MSLLKEGSEECEEHWKLQHASVGNTDFPELVMPYSSVSSYVCRVLYCCRKMLKVPDLVKYSSIHVLWDLLEAFQPPSSQDNIISCIQPSPAPGNIDYLYCDAYLFLEGVLDAASLNSFSLISEVLITLESLVDSIPRFLKSLGGAGKNNTIQFSQAVFLYLQTRLGASARMLLSCSLVPE